MRKRNFILTTAVIALVLTTASLATLDYKTVKEGDPTPVPLRGRYIYALEDKPAADVLPDFQSEDPSFYNFDSPLARGGKLLIAIDREKGSETRNIVYIDTNGDGSLKDEKPVKAYAMTSQHPSFGPFDLTLDGGRRSADYRFRLRLCDHGPLNLYVYSACWYEGQVDIAGRQVHCILLDANANGTFNDKSTDPAMRDMIMLGSIEEPRYATMGNLVDYDGKTYALRVSRSGGNVNISPAEDIQYGKVNLGSAVTEVTAGGPNGLFSPEPKKGLIELPVGTYRLDRYVYQKRKGLDTWRIVGTRPSAKGDFTVTADSTAELEPGDPITAVVTAVAGQEKGLYSFNHTLQGKMEESISLLKNNARPACPKLTITNSSGTYKESYDFKYG